MGYDLHIARATDWLDSAADPITLDEWLNYAAVDPEMRLDGFAEVETSAGEILRTERTGVAVWIGWSQSGVDGGEAWFDHRNGHIVVKNPDEEITQKMISIAGALQARVIGDDGETFPSIGVRAANPKRGASGRPWWRRLFG